MGTQESLFQRKQGVVLHQIPYISKWIVDSQMDQLDFNDLFCRKVLIVPIKLRPVVVEQNQLQEFARSSWFWICFVNVENVGAGPVETFW